jgi:metal-responsive CopG/Arc/MetJ family transcriptional regulator
MMAREFNVQFSFGAPLTMADALLSYADDFGINRSEMIRHCVTEYIERRRLETQRNYALERSISLKHRDRRNYGEVPF